MSVPETVLDLTPVRLGKRFSQRTIASSRGLLPTLYRAAELYDKLDVTSRELHDWMRNGLPYQQDGRGHLWFDGQALAAWVERVRQSWPSQPLQPGEAYCLRCRRGVPLTQPTERREGRHVLLVAQCPVCGCTIHRGAVDDQP